MQLQNSYIFLQNTYKSEKKTEKKVEKNKTTLVLHIGYSVCDYIEKAFPKINKDNDRNIYETKYAYNFETDKYKCDVEFIVTQVLQNQYLDILVQGKTCAQIVSCLEDIQNQLFSSGIRESYIDIISYDAVSEYYCNKILPKLNSLERNLRKLMFNIYILNFGRNYYQTTISDEIQEKIKGVIRAKGSEETKERKRLQEFFYSIEYADIQKILFLPNWTNIDEQMKSVFLQNNKDLSQLTDEELRKAFYDFSPKSDWERFFNEKIPLTDVKDIIEKIRIYRNAIAHFKFFYKTDYSSCVKLVNKLNYAVLNAIQITKKKDFLQKNVENIKNAISDFSKRINEILTPIIKAQQELFNSGVFENISRSIESVIPPFISNAERQPQSEINDIKVE